MAVMAQGWLIVDELGGSALSLGYLGVASSLPTILINLFGGGGMMIILNSILINLYNPKLLSH